MNIPDNLYYTKDHEWIKVEGNEAYIGITDYAQNELGDIVFVELPAAGDSITRGETFGTVEAVKAVSDLFAPAGGTVIEFNGMLEDSPDKINTDPYGEGWMLHISLSDMKDVEDLLSARAYSEFISE